MDPREAETEIGGRQRLFPSTLWTAVLTARDPSSPLRREALQRLIEAYWKPVYFFVRRRGRDREASKDLTQGFFTALLEKNYLQYVDRDRGKFRTFLLRALDHYLADDYERHPARKRGGGQTLLSPNFREAEAQMALEPSSGESPDRAFRRDWALRVLSQALSRLREEFARAGRQSEFEALRLHLSVGAGAAPSYAEIARTLSISEGDVRNRIHRTRARYREAILDVVRSYAVDEQSAEEEIRDLLSAFD